MLNELTHRFSAKVCVPILQPCEQLLGIAFVTLLADNLSNIRRLVLVNPQQWLGCCVRDWGDGGALCQLEWLAVLRHWRCCHAAVFQTIVRTVAWERCCNTWRCCQRLQQYHVQLFQRPFPGLSKLGRVVQGLTSHRTHYRSAGNSIHSILQWGIYPSTTVPLFPTLTILPPPATPLNPAMGVRKCHKLHRRYGQSLAAKCILRQK